MTMTELIEFLRLARLKLKIGQAYFLPVIFFTLFVTNLSVAQSIAIDTPSSLNPLSDDGKENTLSNSGNIKQSSYTQSFDGYPATRTELLNLVSRTKRNLRIVTDFFSDGELASSLFIARYRKVDVKVMLGQARANQIFSRLGFLKEQGIPVWMRPRGFYSESTTLISADGVLYILNADLDSSARHRKFTLTSMDAKTSQTFQDAFEVASIGGIVPQVRRLPQVGRPRPNSRIYRPEHSPPRDTSRNSSPVTNTKNTSGEPGLDHSNSGDAAFRYSGRAEKPSTGVPTKLPRTTILQDRARRDAQPESGDQN